MKNMLRYFKNVLLTLVKAGAVDERRYDQTQRRPADDRVAVIEGGARLESRRGGPVDGAVSRCMSRTFSTILSGNT